MNELKIDLPEDIKSELLSGVVYPDEEKKRNGTKDSHHYGRAREITLNVTEARNNLLIGNHKKAFFYLGVALHYIQDSYVTCKSSNPDEHLRYEGKMDFCYPTNDIETSIQKYLSDQKYLMNDCLRMALAIKSDNLFGKQNTINIARLNARDRPHELRANEVIDLTLGYLASYVVVKSIVLDPINCSQLDCGLNRLHKENVTRLMEIENQLSNNIFQMIGERNRLVSTKNHSNGIIPKIKNWLLKRKIKEKDVVIGLLNSTYFNRDHLKIMIFDYQKEAEGLARKYDGWYSFQIKEINISQIPQEIVQIDTSNDLFVMINIVKRTT